MIKTQVFRWALVATFGLFVGAAGCGKVSAPAADGGAGSIDAPAGATDAGIDAPPADPCAGPSIEIGNLAQCRVLAGCTRQLACGGPYATLDECIADDTPKFTFGFRRALDLANTGKVLYDGTAAFQCFSQIAKLDCDTFVQPEVCAAQLTGTISAGNACLADDECQPSGSQCRFIGCTSQCCTGSCVAPVSIGGVCDGAGKFCGRGDHCGVTVGAPSICRGGAVGDLCGNNGDCDPENACVSGACTARLPLNAACTTDECASTLRCIGIGTPAGGKCGKIDAVGDPCAGGCLGQLFCTLPPPDGLGHCAALPGLNQACANGRCAGDLICDSNSTTCRIRLRENESCQTGQCQYGLFCTSDVGSMMPVCSAPQAVNKTCKLAEECASMVCSPDGTTKICQDYLACP